MEKFTEVGRFKVIVDYSQNLNEMIMSGNYISFNWGIHDRRYKLQRNAGTCEIELAIVNLGQRVTSEEAVAHLKSAGLEPAKIEHLLALGATYPKLQEQFSIICLSSYSFDFAGIRHPYLTNDVRGRMLQLSGGVRMKDDDGRFESSCCFLVVCNK
jgi:hypothetical protein